ncbi:MAG TPA: hypothetical protein VM264_08335 [Acidimicrobiales bacterium]|nr:hypothetical protein [Acidimicrobiales bacterium]
MASQVIRYDDWGAGEYGALGGRRAPVGSWAGNNVMLYRNGSVGPRAGLRNTTPAGLPAGTIWGFASRPVPGGDGVIVVGSGVYTFDLGTPGAAVTSLGNLSQAPTAPVAILPVPGAVYLSSVGDRTYKVTGGVAALPGTAYGGRHLAIHGTRLVIGHLTESGGAPFLRRIRWSDAAAETFSAANFAEAGDPWHISGLHTQRDALTITKQNQFMVLTGSLADLGGTVGLDATIRRVARHDGPLRSEAAVGADELLWFQGLFDRCPGFYTGSKADRLAHLEYTTSTPNDGSDAAPSHAVVALDKAGSAEAGVAFVAQPDARAALLHNGAWSFHTLAAGAAGRGAASDGRLHLASGGQVWTWDYAFDRPGDGSGATSQGDGTAVPVPASLTLPEWWAPSGEVVQVRTVVLELDSYSTGAVATNHVDVVVDCLGPYQGEGTLAATAQSFDRVQGGGSAGSPHRATFGIDGQRGGGFRIRLENIRGCAIRAVTVVADVEGAWTRA